MSEIEIPPCPTLPDVPWLSWATVSMFSLLVLDVSTEIGQYLRAVDRSSRWGADAKPAITRASLLTIIVWVGIMFASAFGMSRATDGMDDRMTRVLEGVSRLESAIFLAFMSHKIPRWVGVYRSGSGGDPGWSSPCRDGHVEDAQSLEEVRSHVKVSISHIFAFDFFLLLPFCRAGMVGRRPLSALIGILAGLLLDGSLYVARRSDGKRPARIAFGWALLVGALSSVMFADGCHYIQTVWRMGIWRSEWGLGVTSFLAWFAMVLVVHRRMWRGTERTLLTENRFSVHERQERLAASLIFSKWFGSDQLEKFIEEQDDDNNEKGSDVDGVDKATAPLPPGTLGKHVGFWSVLRARWCTPKEGGLDPTSSAVWFLLSALSLFIAVVNVGATAQANIVRREFPAVDKALYGQMDQGPVCAFDKPVPGKGDIRTFESRAAAHSAGYTIAHCGVCSNCSDWHNLSKQYTTRTYLAAASARCAKKSLTGGLDAVLKCLESPPIEFRGECAKCWLGTIDCSRRNCAFIFLQSIFINTVGNFEVRHDTITSATCEEAMCELDFVPCSGANRRRMNIRSTIDRPGDQMCKIVDVADWEEIFGEKASGSSLHSGGSSGGEEL